MVSWDRFEAAAPELAAEGRRLLIDPAPRAFLATVRAADEPRIHPVSVAIVDGRLYTFALGAKRQDLESDGRYALHAALDPEVPVEFLVRGRARAVAAGAERDAVAAGWTFEPDETFGLFELGIESALVGRRASDDEWPPRYTRWTAPAG
jgi:hypothetical protein